jgi:hypothetical protein
MRGYIREGLRGAGIWALIVLGALFFSCEQAAGPVIPKPEETPEITEPGETPEPVKYRAAANGVNGEEDSTVILFSFDEDVTDLKAGDLSLVNGGGDTGGRVIKKALAGSGKEWSLGITVQDAGSVTVVINREDIEEGAKAVTVYKAAETIRISYNAAADGGGKRVSSAINFTFGAAIAELSAEDLTIAGDTGRVATGALSGSGQNWFLGITVEIPGDIKVGIAREGIETGERAVTVYKPAAYSIATDGGDGEATSTKIEFTFNAEISGLTAGDIGIAPAEYATKGTLAGNGASWVLEITALKAGDVQVKINKDGIEDRERTATLYLYDKPIGYTAAANGVNGEEDSTAIALNFDADVADLRASQISIVNGEGETGGRAVRGALAGSGKQWTLGIATEKAGSVTVRINRAGIEAGEKPVTVYKEQEQTLVSYNAVANGNGRRASTGINFTFGAAVRELTAEDIVLSDGAGRVAKGALSREGQSWSLGIAVETPGDIKVNITRDGIEAGEKTVTVYKPAAYSITADGTADTASSTKIDFSFNADIAGLTTGEISISPADSVTVGALTGGGSSWSLGITALRAGEIRVRINKDGIEDGEKTATIHQYSPVSYTAAANGVNGTEDSTAIVFSFDKDIADLGVEHVNLVNGTGRVVTGSLTGSGRRWTLGIAVEAAGSVRVAIHKTGVEDGERTVGVYKAAEQTLVSYLATADGGSRRASSAISFSFGEAVALAGADISVSAGTGRVAKGALSGSGKNWSLGIAVETPGDIRVAINRAGIEAGEKTVTVHKPITYEAAADITGGAEPSGRIIFIFSEAVEGLNFGNIGCADAGGSAYPMELSGAGQEWSLTIITIKTGDIRIGIERDGIDEEEKTVGVYKPEEAPPEVAVKTGITVISPPEITLYAKNQSFDLTGLEVGWAYSDGSVEAMAGGYQVDEPDMGKAGPKLIYVRAGGYQTYFAINVLNSEKILTHISVEGPTNKIQEFGKEFDKTGLVVTGHYHDGTSSSLTSLAAIMGYDKYKRGPQNVNVRVNGKNAALEGISTRIGDGAAVSINRIERYFGSNNNIQKSNYKDIYLKGEAMTPRGSNIMLYVAPSGQWGSFYSSTFILSLDNGGLLEEDFDSLTGYSPYQTGWQTCSITVDGRRMSFYVRVMDVVPAVWFDYGYVRHAGDPTGHGPGAGKYYAKPDETLVIAPVRYLLGYNADHSDVGASYSWTVSGDHASRTWTTSNGGGLLHITPKTAGTYTITVSVTGREYVSGSTVTKTTTTELICYDTPLSAGTFASPLRNFAAGQFARGGNGFGWSLGAFGGYEVWTVEHQPSYYIKGNPFAAWLEAGVVWIQEDRNGNGLPDEMWHELRGGDDDDPAWRDYVTRRYAITYYQGDGTAAQQGTSDATASYWVDSKGRAGILPSAFPSKWGVTGDWATYTGTLLRDNGNTTGGYSGLSEMYGYVDAMNSTFYVNKAMSADGTPVSLSAVKFIKVHTGVLRYGGIFGEVSTEIKQADFLGQQSDFPDP